MTQNSQACKGESTLGAELSDGGRPLHRYEPRGVYPGTYTRGQLQTKSSFFYAPSQRANDGDGHPIVETSYAEGLLANMPLEVPLATKREYWEHSLLAVYFHLYGIHWSHWAALIPWRDVAGLEALAKFYSCDYLWDWVAKRRFLETNGFRWNLKDLDYLIDRYPEYQVDDYEQQFFVTEKSFEDIRLVARTLCLPTTSDLLRLCNYAKKLH